MPSAKHQIVDIGDGLRDIVQKRLHTDVFKNTCDKWPGWMILVVDAAGLRMISSAMGMYDLMEHRVTTVENLGMKRAPFKDMAVIYLLEPTDESISKVMADWADVDTNAEGRAKRLYANSIFLYFLYRVPDELVAKIKTCVPLLKRLKVFSEVNVNFIAKESHTFHLDMKKSLTTLYSSDMENEDGDSMMEMEEEIVMKLVTFCATMHEYPYIRYKDGSKVAAGIASKLQAKMNEFLRQNVSWWYFGDSRHASKERGTLLILDRSDDTISPLVHEFTYQAMVNDLLTVDDDKITYTAPASESKEVDEEEENEEVAKDVLLNDNDDVWVELRGKHIADVLNTLSTRIKEVVNTNSGASLASDGSKNLSLSEMASALKALPEYKEIMSKLTQHMHIAHQCMTILQSSGLLDLSELEQTLATGTDEDGKSPKLTDLIQQMEELLPNLSDENKLRLLCLFFTSQKESLSEKEIERVHEFASISSSEQEVLDQQKILEGFTQVEETQQSAVSKFGNLFGKKVRSANVERMDSNSEYSSCRYVTNVKSLLDNMINDRLSEEKYPGTTPLPAHKSTTAASVRTRVVHGTKWGGKDKKKKTYTGAKQMIFIVGGICHSEMRAAYEMMEAGEKEIMVGSTEFLTPQLYLEELRGIH